MSKPIDQLTDADAAACCKDCSDLFLDNGDITAHEQWFGHRTTRNFAERYDPWSYTDEDDDACEARRWQTREALIDKLGGEEREP